MKLYLTLRSPYARKSRIIALEKGIHLDFVEEDLTQKSSALLEKNPLGKVPTLELDDGTVLTDSSLINEYLDSLKSEPRFIPLDPKQRLHVLNIDALGKGLTDVTVQLFYEKLIHPEDANEELVHRLEKTVCRSLKYLDTHCQELDPFHLGSISAATAIGYIRFRHDHLWQEEQYPALARWFQGISERPSLQQTIPQG